MITVTLPPNSARMLLRMVNMPSVSRIGMTRGWQQLGESLKRDADREILKHPKSGRLYIVRGGREGRGALKRHRASAPGETHANLTGRTRRSLSWRSGGADEMAFGYGVGSNRRGNPPPYAKMLEFGTKRMKSRPSLFNAIRGNIRNAQTYFGVEIRRVLIRSR